MKTHNKRKLVFWNKSTGSPVEDNFLEKPEYHAFFARCNEVFDFRIAMDKSAYAGGGIFSEVCEYKDHSIVSVAGMFKADIIYQRKKPTDDFDNAVPIVNSMEFKNWCPDKWNQYELLKEFMPKTFLIKTEEHLKNYLPAIVTSKAILRPRRGQEGKDIIVFDTALVPKLNHSVLVQKNYLLSEWADTDVSIPGLVTGIHDIKLITIDDHVFANLRTPEAGKIYCTFDSPYSEALISLLPKEILDVHTRVRDKVAALFPGQLYTVDVGMTPNGPKVFELNGHTAFPYLHFGYTEEFFDALIKHLESM